jgi:hypothetical protein
MLPHQTHITRFKQLALVLLCSCFIGLSGCTQSEPKFPFEGELTLDGQPLDNVTLILTPKGKGQSVAVSVAGGTFTLPAAIGPSAGVYSIRVNPMDGNDSPEIHVKAATGSKKKRLVPMKYQTDGKLSVTVTGKPGEKFQLVLKSTEQ